MAFPLTEKNFQRESQQIKIPRGQKKQKKAKKG